VAAAAVEATHRWVAVEATAADLVEAAVGALVADMVEATPAGSVALVPEALAEADLRGAADSREPIAAPARWASLAVTP
jgi:hypothetical protein